MAGPKEEQVDKKGPCFFLFWVVVILTVTGLLAGGIFGSLAGMDKIDDEVEMRAMRWAYAWALPAELPLIISFIVVSRKINTSFLHDFSTGESIKEAARASWTNTGLVSALIFTIAVALWMADVPGELDDPATHWFLIFACAATLMSGHRAFGLTCVELLGARTYLQYGSSALLVISAFALASVLFAMWEYKVVSGYVNIVDGQRTTLESLAQVQVKLGFWWLFVEEDSGEIDGSLVPQDDVQKIVAKAGKHWLYSSEQRLVQVEPIEEHFQRMERGGAKLVVSRGGAKSNTPWGDGTPLDLLLSGHIFPTADRGVFHAVDDDGRLVHLQWTEDGVISAAC